MTRNVGNAERIARALVAVALIVAAFLAPLPLVVRAAGLGGMAAYMLFTALSGTCLGYKMMGYSTCPVSQRS